MPLFDFLLKPGLRLGLKGDNKELGEDTIMTLVEAEGRSCPLGCI